MTSHALALDTGYTASELADVVSGGEGIAGGAVRYLCAQGRAHLVFRPARGRKLPEVVYFADPAR